MGLVCIQNSSLLVCSKSQKVSASYCLLFEHSRGKNQVNHWNDLTICVLRTLTRELNCDKSGSGNFPPTLNALQGFLLQNFQSNVAKKCTPQKCNCF